MIQVYSRKTEGDTPLSAHFKAREFACADGSDPIFVDSALVELLQAVREHFGHPVTVTSGYRTPAHNQAVGGAAYSQHLYGRAADIQVPGVSPQLVAAYAETLLPGRGGIGCYPPTNHRSGWVHLDVRAQKSRWNG